VFHPNLPDRSRPRPGPRLAVTLAALALVAALLPSAVSAGALNTAVLDNGTCGHNLQLGSDPTASSSATPWFLLYGDGAAASYSIAIDGVSIGTFTTSDMFGNVCISDTRVLSQGTHTLTGNELAPHATYTVTPFIFSVDSIPSAVPSAPVLSPASDTGVQGDNITTVRNPTLTGTAEPNIAIRMYNGLAGVGGARADATGHWSVATATMTDGVHTLTAASVDQAGNISAKSAPLMLTIGSASPTVPGAPTLTSATAGSGQVSLAWTAPASNGGSAITGYRVYRSTSAGGETLYTSLGNVTSYTDVGLANGTTYYYKVAAVNSVGTGPLSNERSAAPVAGATVPGAPQNLVAVQNKPKGIALAWSASATNGGSAITGYRILRSTSAGTETLYATVGAITSYTDPATTRGVTYYYKVTAVNNVGAGPSSNEANAVGR
jgi:hypothetical protein